MDNVDARTGQTAEAAQEVPAREKEAFYVSIEVRLKKLSLRIEFENARDVREGKPPDPMRRDCEMRIESVRDLVGRTRTTAAEPWDDVSGAITAQVDRLEEEFEKICGKRP